MADCPHGLDDRWCATCLHGPVKTDDSRPHGRVTAHTIAKFPARCRWCGDDIKTGSPIARIEPDADEAVWVHEDPCAERAAA